MHLAGFDLALVVGFGPSASGDRLTQPPPHGGFALRAAPASLSISARLSPRFARPFNKGLPLEVRADDAAHGDTFLAALPADGGDAAAGLKGLGVRIHAAILAHDGGEP